MNNRKITIIIFSTIGALIVFQMGIFVGYHKALFSYGSGDRVYQMIRGGEPNVFFKDLPGGHGATGRIVSVTPPTFMISSPDNIERTIIVSSSTDIRRFRSAATIGDMNSDDTVLVLGNPDGSGRIMAKFIRISPQPKN